MKRIVFFAISLVLLAPAAFSQSGDARAIGLAGAMTAVNDDMNSLFYNPAGLAYLREKFYLQADGNVAFRINQGTFATEESLPQVWYDSYSESYQCYSDFYNQNVDFDFDAFYDSGTSLATHFQAFVAENVPGTAWTDLTGQQKNDLYSSFRQLRTFYDEFQNVKPIRVSPRLVLGGPHWGLAFLGDFLAIPTLGAYANEMTPASLLVDRTLGAVAGLGLKFGALALGVNAKYLMDSTYMVTVDDYASFANDGPPEDFITALFSPENTIDNTTRVELGFGSVLSLGTLNLGVYEGNLLPFLQEDYAAQGDNFFGALLDAMNFGLSWMPSDNKYAKSRSPLTLILTADLKNFGDEVNRQLCAAAEMGLDVPKVLAIMGRVGYTQLLPGTLDEMFSSFEPDNGYLTAGITGRVWIANINLAFKLPVEVFSEMWRLNGTMTEEERAQEFGTVTATVSLRF